MTADTITVEQIRELRETGPRTIEYLNTCDMALAALRGEFGAGIERAALAILWCAEAINARESGAEATCSRCGCPVHRTWDHLDIGDHGERWTCISKACISMARARCVEILNARNAGGTP